MVLAALSALFPEKAFGGPLAETDSDAVACRKADDLWAVAGKYDSLPDGCFILKAGFRFEDLGTGPIASAAPIEPGRPFLQLRTTHGRFFVNGDHSYSGPTNTYFDILASKAHHLPSDKYGPPWADCPNTLGGEIIGRFTDERDQTFSGRFRIEATCNGDNMVARRIALAEGDRRAQ